MITGVVTGCEKRFAAKVGLALGCESAAGRSGCAGASVMMWEKGGVWGLGVI